MNNERKYKMKKYEYVVIFKHPICGTGLTWFYAYDAEDLAEQFFKIYKHVDYEIYSKTEIEE